MSRWIVRAKMHDDDTVKEVIFAFDGLDKYDVGTQLYSMMYRLGYTKEDYATEYKEFEPDGKAVTP